MIEGIGLKQKDRIHVRNQRFAAVHPAGLTYSFPAEVYTNGVGVRNQCFARRHYNGETGGYGAAGPSSQDYGVRNLYFHLNGSTGWMQNFNPTMNSGVRNQCIKSINWTGDNAFSSSNANVGVRSHIWMVMYVINVFLCLEAGMKTLLR